MTEQDKQIIPLIHCMAVAVNTADAIRVHLKCRNKMPTQMLKKDLNKSMMALYNLQFNKIEVKGEEGKVTKVTFLDIIFSDNKRIVDIHTDLVLQDMEKSVADYIALCLVIKSVLEKAESIYKNPTKKNLLFWGYIKQLYFPVKRYFTEDTELIASKFIDNVTRLISVK